MERYRTENKEGYRKDLEIQHLEAQLKAKSVETDSIRSRYHRKLSHKDKKKQEQESEWKKSYDNIVKEVNGLRVDAEVLQRENVMLKSQLAAGYQDKRMSAYEDTVHTFLQVTRGVEGTHRESTGEGQGGGAALGRDKNSITPVMMEKHI